MSALLSEADNKLVQVNRAANDPKRTFPVHEHVQRWLNLRGFTKTRTGSLFVERYRQSLEFSERTGFFRLAHDKINQALKNVT